MFNLALLSQRSSRHDDYDVLCDGAVVGRIIHFPAAPEAKPWMGSLAFGYHRDRMPSYGYEPTREATIAAFAKSWRRERVTRATIVIVALLLLSIPVRGEPLPMPKPPSSGCPYGCISNGWPHKKWITRASTLAQPPTLLGFSAVSARPPTTRHSATVVDRDRVAIANGKTSGTPSIVDRAVAVGLRASGRNCAAIVEERAGLRLLRHHRRSGRDQQSEDEAAHDAILSVRRARCRGGRSCGRLLQPISRRPCALAKTRPSEQRLCRM
jgi:hypothetical protein